MDRGDFLDRLYEYCEEGQIETRALPKKKQTFHSMRDWSSIDEWCKVNEKQNLYFAVATRNGGGTKNHIKQIPACWLDIDYKDFSSPKDAKRAVWQFQYRPSVIVDSGGGLHCYWRFKEPAGKEDIPQVEKLNRILVDCLGGDAQAVDASRILRLPGSINFKYENQPAVRVVREDWEREYNLDDLLDDPPLTNLLNNKLERVGVCGDSEADFEGDKRDIAGQNGTNGTTGTRINFAVGHHDETLFSIAWHLARGGMPEGEVLKVIEYTAKNLDPNNETKQWAREKVRSAYNRLSRKGRVTAGDIREWVRDIWGTFCGTEGDKYLGIRDKRDMEIRKKTLQRLCAEGIIERVNGKNNLYRKIETECEKIDFLNAPTEEVNLTLPLGLSNYFTAYSKNIIVVAGDQDAGKTALLLNMVRDNQHNHKINYFSSEMGNSELRIRLSRFPDTTLRDWKFNAFERSDNFSDVIDPDAINVIDYLEIDDAFYQVSGKLRAIHDKLQNGIAIVALQKSKGQDIGRGGSFSLEKPRLYVSISNEYPGHRIKIVKCKNWRSHENPNRLSRKFKIAQGCVLIPDTEWDIE
jgi:hypothetical protein